MYYTDNILTLIFFMQTVATEKMQTHNTCEWVNHGQLIMNKTSGMGTTV